MGKSTGTSLMWLLVGHLLKEFRTGPGTQDLLILSAVINNKLFLTPSQPLGTSEQVSGETNAGLQSQLGPLLNQPAPGE